MQIVDGKDYLSEVKDLIIEYSKRLGRDLSFQNIDEELQDPAHKYTAPEGEILVAIVRRHIVGGANGTLISALLPLRLCCIGDYRRLLAG